MFACRGKDVSPRTGNRPAGDENMVKSMSELVVLLPLDLVVFLVAAFGFEKTQLMKRTMRRKHSLWQSCSSWSSCLNAADE